jgi:hypothetical protein
MWFPTRENRVRASAVSASTKRSAAGRQYAWSAIFTVAWNTHNVFIRLEKNIEVSRYKIACWTSVRMRGQVALRSAIERFTQLLHALQSQGLTVQW